MKNRFKFQLISYTALLSIVMVLISCKKKADTALTEPAAPTATTNAATYVGQTWAVMNGTVNANDKSTIVSFDYDTTISYGQNIFPTHDTVSGNLSTYVNASLGGLISNTTYHYRLRAVNSLGTTLGDDMTFTTKSAVPGNSIFNPDLTYGSLNDNDGHTYKTIQLGTRTWMAENLKSTKFNDNTLIPFVPDDVVWSELTTPGYCWYNNDSISYGALYNWYSVNTGKLCPAGWHVPTDEEWTSLTNFLGGDSIAGNKLRETGTLHWQSPNSGSTNESGFTGLAGGYRNTAGSFGNIRKIGYWWSASAFNTIDAYYRFVSFNYDHVVRSNSSLTGGFSVRCVKND
jgi:uncharacterized protein (TIGR02145 family)